jgi:shikimate kinase
MSNMAKNTLVLTGFMGMGKSTAGRLAAELLSADYYDTDDWMEKVMGLDVPSLIKTDVQSFRGLEALALQDILRSRRGVISTGGGIISTEVGRAALSSSMVPVVWLKAPFEVAEARVAKDSGRERPLFADVDGARKLFDERQQWYEATSTHVVDASRPAALVVDDIRSILHP